MIGHRELLKNLVSRDLNARYKGSILGVAWSLLNPFLQLAIYSVAFSVIFGARAPDVAGHKGNYAIFFMAAFLPWIFFSSSLTMGTTAILSQSGLVQKVFFPRELLPLSLVVANLVNLGLSFAIVLPFALYQGHVSLTGVLLLVPVTVGLFLLSSGIAIILSAINIYFRDVEFLIGIAVMAWFYLTPIAAPESLIRSKLPIALYANPLTPFVGAFRDALFAGRPPSLRRVAECVVVGVVGFAVCYAWFNRLKGRLTEEL